VESMGVADSSVRVITAPHVQDIYPSLVKLVDAEFGSQEALVRATCDGTTGS